MRPTLIPAALASATFALITTPATASAESPVETIGILEAEGYTVNIDRVGNAPLEECIVTSVRNPQTVTKWVRVRDKHDKDDFVLVQVVVSRSISVSLDCSG